MFPKTGFVKGTYRAPSYTYAKDVPKWVMVDQFNSSYYSGLDISVYFGAVYMDEVISLQYQEVEQVKPNFSYASYTYNSISRGARLVTGSFTINFKESGYLYNLLKTLRNTGTMEANLQRMYSGEADYPYSKEAKDRLEKVSVVQDALANDFTLEDFVAIASSGSKVYNKDNYQEVMDQLDTAIWEPAAHYNDRDVVTKRNSETKRGVDLDTAKFRGPSLGFDVIIKYGQPEDAGKGKPGWGTIETVRGCHITGVSKTIDDTGKNTLEVYSFVGQTVE
jgi:hypothetical protein